MSPAFLGFSPTDIDTFICRAYKPNDNYQHLVDTFLVGNRGGGTTVYTSLGDTTIVFINSSDPNELISEGFDWQIFIPAKNRTITISNITTSQTDGSTKGCMNPIHSFVMDGQFIVPKLIRTGNDFTSGYMAYIHL